MDNQAKIFLGLALIIVMIGMGLSLELKDFKRIIKYPKAIILGLFNQIILLPIVAYWIIFLFDIRPTLAVGLMLIALCPGGPTSNFITFLSKGDTALSVSLTAFSSVLTLFTIPVILEWALVYYQGSANEIVINRFDIFKELIMVTIVPISIGMLIKHYKAAFAVKMEKAVKIASALILLVLIVGLSIKESDKIIPYFTEVGLSTFSLNAISLVLGFVSAKLFYLNTAQSISVAIESGIQNGTLAIAIALGVLGNNDFAIPAAVYSLVMFLNAFVVIALSLRFWKKQKAKNHI